MTSRKRRTGGEGKGGEGRGMWRRKKGRQRVVLGRGFSRGGNESRKGNGLRAGRK